MGATSGDKCFDLYSRVKKGQLAAQVGKTKEEIEFEASKEEMTLKPKINEPGTYVLDFQKDAEPIE